ncbi:hypothetical protein BKH41_08045 [Helicobacter sp. 12S02232-10]|uniref:hypothetical protein n=1 Tax=Helicobacter sp. 12S02232-10 TaxID=1476197 RepID=UPI000BA57013|nr:hypothetical protein [Helicobacter sp. 12S02232-10]PAF47222.1 hypothetical protein BKH41_08045 [Helicobacter sp. 12S02232-10]
MKTNLLYTIKPSVLIMAISFILGIITTNTYFYQKGFQEGYIKKTKDFQNILNTSTSIATTKLTPQTPFNPTIQKPKFYMGKIYGSITYNHALKVAQDYYEKGAYENAIIWAYRANQINTNDIQSWKIYTQSLSKMGKEKEAQELMQKAEVFFKKKHK